MVSARGGGLDEVPGEVLGSLRMASVDRPKPTILGQVLDSPGQGWKPCPGTLSRDLPGRLPGPSQGPSKTSLPGTLGNEGFLPVWEVPSKPPKNPHFLGTLETMGFTSISKTDCFRKVQIYPSDPHRNLGFLRFWAQTSMSGPGSRF